MLVKLISIILADTFTSDDLVTRIALLREYYGARLFSGRTDESVNEILGPDATARDRGIITRWEESFRNAGITEETIYSSLETIETEVAHFPHATLYLPVKFTPEYVAGFGAWFREHVQPNVLLSVRTDARVAGGCAIVWNSIFHDFSLRYFMRAHRKELVAMFDRHTTPTVYAR